MPPPSPRRHRTRRLIAIGSVSALAVTGVLAGRAIADTPSGSGRYRTATVTRTSVDQTLQRSGTVEPVAQATVAFPISGSVAGVSVQPGDSVTTGQTLATIDTTALQSTLTQKQAALAAAQLTLEKALTTTTSASPASSGSAPSSTSSTASLQSAARTVTTGQKQVDDALTQARAALQAAATACASQSTATPSSTTSTTTASTSSSSESDACAQALQNALAGEQDVATAQTGLAAIESAYADALVAAGASVGTPTSSAQGPASAPSAGSSSTAAELVADQAAVDAAAAEVTAAQQNLAQGTIVSPFDGTVAAVGLKPGDTVSAGSSTADVVVVGPGGYEVTTTVPVADIGKVGIGDTASVTPDGAAQAIAGKVVSIGMAPTTSGTTTTYPVVVGFTEQPSGLRNGGSAAVTIVLDHATAALAVPTSAIRSTGRGQTVVVLAKGVETVTPVQVGVLGSELTEIRSGLQQGDTVVLADLNQPIPSSTASTTRFGGGGGIGGGGALGGGGGIGRGVGGG